MKLLLVKYGRRNLNREYAMTETPAHFGITAFTASPPYSLHTEYSARPRKLSPDLVKNFLVLSSSVSGIPRLWVNDDWAIAFAEWLISLIQSVPPAVVEVHPPFREDCQDIYQFLGRFDAFANLFLSHFPSTKIAIENRCGNQRHIPFLVSSPIECRQLSEYLPATLKLCVDFPQLFTSACKTHYPSEKEIDEIFTHVEAFRDSVFSIHLWGRQNGHAHMGDLLSLFQGNKKTMNYFLQRLNAVFEGRALYLVPEVNSKAEHMENLLDQIEQSGIKIGC